MKRFALIAALCFLTSWASASDFDHAKASVEAGDAEAQFNLALEYTKVSAR